MDTFFAIETSSYCIKVLLEHFFWGIAKFDYLNSL
jgi:hypothetical protein